MTIKINRPEAFRDKPGAVIFDTDNTLYPYEGAHHAALEAARSKASRVLGITPDQFDQAFREARDSVKSRLNGTASSHSRLLYFQRMLELLGLRTQVLLALDFEQTYWRVFLGNADLFPDVKDFLDDLRILGVATAIVTDLTAQIQFRKIVYFGLDHYFDYVVTSEEAGFDKPHPSPFRLVMEKIGPVSGPIWMIGDSAACDVEGAKKALNAVTWQKIHKGVQVGQGDAQPDGSFTHYKDLSALLARTPSSQEVGDLLPADSLS